MKKPINSWFLGPWEFKLDLKMKLSFLFLFTTVFMIRANSSYSQNVRVSLDIQNATVAEVIDEIEATTEFKFLFNIKEVNLNRKISLTVRKQRINRVLDKLFSRTQTSYEVDNRKILLFQKRDEKSWDIINKPEKLQYSVTGSVLDSNGIPLAGANILEKGTTNGTLTDFDGNFSIDVAGENAVLVISYLGFRTMEVPVDVQTAMSITMAEDAAGLDEVVVVGYGTQEKTKVTGSVASVGGEAIENVPVPGASQALQGRAAGVNVVRNGGAPGQAGQIRVRGTGTVNNASPLVVIDGVPSGSIDDINPNDIQSIEVLKDASTSAIYGLRAANGVVLVTTKKGRRNQKLSVTINGYAGFSNAIKTIDVLEAPDLVTLKKERYTNDGIEGNAIWDDPYYAVQRTNWQDELLGTGSTNNIDFTITGGSEKSAYSISGGYFKEDGMIKNSFYKRINFRINSDHKLTKWLTFGENMQLTRQSGNFLNTNSAQSGYLWSAIRFNPALPVRNEDGSYSSTQVSTEFGDINNPVYMVDITDQEETRNRLLGNIYTEFNLMEGLKFRANFAVDATLKDWDEYSPQITDQTRQNDIADLYRRYEEQYSLLNEYYLTYQKVVADAHNVKFVGGYTTQAFETDWFSAEIDGFSNEDPTQRVPESGETLDDISGNKEKIRLASYFGRLNYDYKGKYLFSAVFRRDGTSRFAEDNRWGNFPAFSAGWRVSEEDWFKSNTIDNIKLSGSWGRLGNQNVDPFQYLALINASRRYSFGGEQITGASLSRIPNVNIGWEIAELTDFGVEFDLFDYKLNGKVGYFIKETEDMLLAPASLSSLGRADIPDQNVGSLRNKGLEIELSYNGTFGDDLSFSIAANASFIDNEILDLGENEFLQSQFYGRPNQEITRTFVGQPIGTFYGWRTDGLYQNASEVANDPNITNDPRRAAGSIQPGDVRFVDMTGDGIIDDQDRVVIGDPNPDVTYGLNLGLNYKNFDINAFFLGEAGVDIYNADRMQGLDPTYPFNMYAEAINRWNGEGTSNSIPRMTTNRDNLNHRTSDLFVENGGFFRLKNLSIGYNLPSEILNPIGIEKIRIYVTGQNVFTITDYSGMDPELGYINQNTYGNLQKNVDYAQYPQARTFTLGTTIKF
ncbi:MULTISPECIES: TonB-dependent receptor [Flavobacteriaceae]|uniref:TonB-dependent receptor n=1 Tax=Flavobacteriaceae TaxID=49546 RepID=UPI00149117BF|nr:MULTISPECIES: TonB-dependent receptor [Allomuricauda]MDC6365862.1 TonB-dependent receptor [Muricauda sp. AC10]